MRRQRGHHDVIVMRQRPGDGLAPMCSMILGGCDGGCGGDGNGSWVGVGAYQTQMSSRIPELLRSIKYFQCMVKIFGVEF